MSSVDNRVVSMKFDNKSFENNMKTTMSTLDKLKASLKLDGASKGLDKNLTGNMSTLDKLKAALRLDGGTKGINDVQNASSKFNMNPMGVAIEGINGKFLALSSVAITALSNITSKAVDAGIQLGKSLSIDQVTSGFSEYETNMNSIQTILANTRSDGKTLDDVTAALDDLNKYSDQTIYNFSQMAKNIGTFTAAGVSLDDSTNAIKGISNLAAISGTSAESASTAMNQLSQALAAGKVNLMDWQSVNSAGMGGEIFKKSLFETGKALGTIKDVPLTATFEEWEKKGGTFRDQMQKGWITADVLKTSLSAFSGELDAAALSELGFSDKAAQDMEDLGKLGLESATQIKTMSQLMGTLKESVGSGWSESFRTVIGDFGQAKKLFTGLGNLFGASIQKSSKTRNDLLKGWAAFGGRDTLFQTLLIGFDAVNKALKPIKDAFRAIFPPTSVKDLIDITNGIRDFVSKLVLSKTSIDQLTRIFKGFFSIVNIGWTVFKELGKVVLNLFGMFSGAAGGGAMDFFVNIGDSLTNLNKKLVEGGGIADFFKKIVKTVTDFAAKIDFSGKVEKVTSALTKFKDKILNLFEGDPAKKGEKVASTFDSLKKKLEPILGIGESIRKVWDKLFEVFDTIAGAVKDVGGAIWDELSGVWKNISKQLKGGSEFSGILKAVNTGLIGGLLLAFRKLANDGLKIDFGFRDVLDGIRNSIDGLTSHLKVMQGEIKARTLLKIAEAIALLTVSVVVLSMIDAGALTKALTAMTVGFGQLVGTMALLSKMNSGLKLPLLTASLVALSFGILILALAVKTFSTMKPEELAYGLASIAAVMGMLVLVVKNFSTDTKNIIKAGLSMIFMAIAVNILARAVGKFGKMDAGAIAKGVIAVAASLGVLIFGFNRIDEQGGRLIKASFAIYAMAKSVEVMYKAVKDFGELDPWVLVRGLIAVGVVIELLTRSVQKMPKDITKVSIGLTLIAFAMKIMLSAVEDLGKMRWQDVVKGVLGLAGVMLVMVVASRLMVDALPGAIAIVVMSGAMLILSEALKALGKLSWGEIGKGLAALAGVLLIFGLAGYLLTPVVGTLFAFGIALLTIAAAVLVFGLSAVLFASAFETFAKFGKAGIDLFVEAMDALITRIPEILIGLANGIVDMLNVFVERAPEIVDGIVNLVGTMLDGLKELIPKVGEIIGALIDVMVVLIKEHSQEFIDAGFKLLTDFLQGLSDNIEEITRNVSDIIVKFLEELAKSMPFIIAAGADLMIKFIEGVTDNIKDIIGAVGTLIITFLGALQAQVQPVIDAGVDLIKELIKGFGKAAKDIVEAGVDAAVKFLDGLGDNAEELADAAFDFIIDVIEGLERSIRKNSKRLRDAGWELAKTMIDGLSGGLASKAKGVIDTAIKPLKDAWNGVTDLIGSDETPEKTSKQFGEDVVRGFATGVNEARGNAENSTTTFGNSVVSALNKTFSNISTGLASMPEFRPIISPVLDLTSVKKDAGLIGAALSAQDLAASVSYGQASSIVSANAASTAQQAASSESNSGPIEIKFIQNNTSPEALSTNTIYRQTRSLIPRIKEELGVP